MRRKRLVYLHPMMQPDGALSINRSREASPVLNHSLPTFGSKHYKLRHLDRLKINLALGATRYGSLQLGYIDDPCTNQAQSVKAHTYYRKG